MNEKALSQPRENKTKGNPFAYPIYLVGAVAGLLSAWSILAFMLYLFDFQNSSSFFEAFQRGPTLEPWSSLSTEIWLYQHHGYNLNWLNWHWFKFVRSNLYPYTQYLDLSLIRAYGFLTILPPLFVLCGTAWFSGRVRHQRIVENFENISSTRVHLLLQSRYLVYSLLFLFLSFHFGHIPLIGNIPIYIPFSLFGVESYVWLSSPMMFLVGIAPLAIFVSYNLAKHFTSEI